MADPEAFLGLKNEHIIAEIPPGNFFSQASLAIP
jgi:hypothetical protein